MEEGWEEEEEEEGEGCTLPALGRMVVSSRDLTSLLSHTNKGASTLSLEGVVTLGVSGSFEAAAGDGPFGAAIGAGPFGDGPFTTAVGVGPFGDGFATAVGDDPFATALGEGPFAAAVGPFFTAVSFLASASISASESSSESF